MFIAQSMAASPSRFPVFFPVLMLSPDFAQKQRRRRKGHLQYNSQFKFPHTGHACFLGTCIEYRFISRRSVKDLVSANSGDISKKTGKRKQNVSAVFLKLQRTFASMSPSTETVTHSVKSADVTPTFRTARARIG